MEVFTTDSSAENWNEFPARGLWRVELSSEVQSFFFLLCKFGFDEIHTVSVRFYGLPESVSRFLLFSNWSGERLYFRRSDLTILPVSSAIVCCIDEMDCSNFCWIVSRSSLSSEYASYEVPHVRILRSAACSLVRKCRKEVSSRCKLIGNDRFHDVLCNWKLMVSSFGVVVWLRHIHYTSPRLFRHPARGDEQRCGIV